jgi:hypothetical protein
MEIERDDVQLVIGIEQQWQALSAALGSKHVEAGDDLGCLEEHGRYHRAHGPRVERRNDTLGQRLNRSNRHVDDGHAFFSEAIGLSPQAVEFTVSGDDARTLQEREGRQPSSDELVRVLAKRDVLCAVAQETRKACAHGRRLFGRSRPFVIDELGRVEPGTLLRLEPDIRPRLVRVACQEEAFGDAESRVILGEGIFWQSTVSGPQSTFRVPGPGSRAPTVLLSPSIQEAS